MKKRASIGTWGASAACAVILAGCAAPPPPRYASYRPAAAAPVAPPPPIYFYASKGQGPDQVDRDRYECNDWAVKQSGYDPSRPQPSTAYAPSHVYDPAPARDTAAGALTGAAVGAIASDPRHAGEGAVVGAVAGAIIGSVADNQRQEAIQHTNDARDARASQQAAAQSSRYDNYRRALEACGVARGYEVR